MNAAKTNHISLSFDAISENEAFARMTAAMFMAQLNPTLDDVEDVKTAVSEAVTNAIIHGYEKGDDNISSGQAEHQAAEEKSCPQVHMNCSYIGRELYIEISDSGVGIQDVAKAMEPLYTSKPQLDRSGMGFSFMEAFMDALTVTSEPRNNSKDEKSTMKSDKISRLVTENINLIYLVMKRFRNRGVDREDLFQIGAVGLTKAAQRFDESKGFAFSTYAVPLIIGEIQRFLRDDGMVHISRKIRDDARKIAIIREKYRMNENSEISLEKMEIISGMSKQDIIIAMEADKNASSIENESVLDYLDNKMSAEASDKPSETDKVINNIAMQQAFNSLDDSERRLIMLRYMQDKTQKQVAEVLGRNQVAISRMEKNTLAKLRRAMM